MDLNMDNNNKEMLLFFQTQSFKRKLDIFIEARDTSNGNGGGQFWPLVKQVKIYLPNCTVCNTGAKLVDLPGVRDSNAARDKIARDVSTLFTTVFAPLVGEYLHKYFPSY